MPSDSTNVRAKLDKLRDSPAGTQAASEDVLALIYKFLIKDDDPPRAAFHWFCSRADQTTIDAATFLLRLHAYNSVRVTVWRSHLQSCLAKCTDCIQALQDAKITSRHTFFGAFKDDVLETFYNSFSNWETTVVLDGLSEAKIDPATTSDARRTLSAAPLAFVYHMLCNLQIVQDSKVMAILQDCTPAGPISGWPADRTPVGLLLLLMHHDARIRTWAIKQVATYKKTPMKSDHFLPMYVEALERATKAVGLYDTQLSKVGRADETVKDSFPFCQESAVLWSGYCAFLRFVPPERFQPSELFRMDLRHIVIGHLSDPGKHFLDVLRSFLLILNRVGPEMWKGEGAEYPLVVFSTIKDNPRYIEYLRSDSPAGQDPWTLSCLQSYLKSLGSLPAFNDVLPVMVQFLSEELQHERFQNIQPNAVAIASKMLYAVIPDTPTTDASQELKSVWESLDIHAGRFVTAAFSPTCSSDAWKEARYAARNLISTALTWDVKNITTVVAHLSAPAKYPDPIVVPRIREYMWKKIYETIHHKDTEGAAVVLHVLAQISHVDVLLDTAFAEALKASADPAAAKKAFSYVNLALGVFRSGFSDAVSRILDFSSSSTMVRLLRQPTVVQSVMALMFSPVEDIREAAQAVAGLALDVETRQDCFRALLSAHPNSALNGIFDFLETFNFFAQVVPEACSVSKSLALCLTDIIDVMCSSPDGLLLKADFLKSIAAPGAAVELPKWWNLMTKALSIIFLRTARWATYFENATMVLWMRDALIFGRDLLAQRKVIETGALSSQQVSSARSRKLSHIGKKMVDDLQPVLQELTRWLRLTDEELLFQSFSLLQSLLGCFRETQIPPAELTLQKLQKHVDDARKKDPGRPQTRLDAPRLARLQEALSSFEDDDDEVEIISHTKPPAKASSSKQITSRDVRRAKDIPRSNALVKPAAPQKGRTSEATQARHVPTKLSTYFSADDQKRLASASSLPKFSKMTTTPPTASSSKQPVAVPKPGEKSNASVKVASQAPSSSSESESDGEGALASLAKIQRTPTIKKPMERRQVKMLDLPMNGKNPAFNRLNRRDDARRTGMRLKPDISPLHRQVLSWKYEHVGPEPPGERAHLQHVPDTFTDIQHYRRVFEPLLLSECWAQIQQSKDEPQERYECRIVSRQFTDDWLDLEITISDSVRKDWYLTDTDVVLLALPGSQKTHLGKVQYSRSLPSCIQSTVRILVSGQDGGPQISATWTLAKVFSLTTLHREYAALMGLPYYDLSETIMRPALSKKTVVDESEVQQTMSAYKLNEPQAKAILNSMETDGFSLIQGPPGTGKTSTICGLVQMFLQRRPKPATAIHVGRTAGPADREPPRKILLCAPSNAAIDEITYRLKEGVSGAGRKDTAPKVVRVGAPKGMNVSIKDVSLDFLVEQKLNADPASRAPAKDSGSDIARVRAELESLKQHRTRTLEEITNTHDNVVRTSVLEEEIKKLNKQRHTLTRQLDTLRDKQKSDSRTLDAMGRRCRLEVLQEADVICSTLSGAGHELLEAFDFEMVVIDEAAQAIELSSLIPLKYRCSRCIMVGDPQQLPPTVISQEATRFSYNQSLFVRLQKHRPEAVHLLSIQYRMHPDISRLPSRLFYSGRLLDGPDMAGKTQKPWHSNLKFGTYRFYNVNRGQEQTGSNHSLVNRTESQVAVALYSRLTQEFSSYDFEYKVGVVTMYRAQVGELRRAFEQKFGSGILSTVDFHTVDGFQGQEKEVIILSCVRAGPGLQNVGFLSDIRRMNVALTRAKSSVFVLGHAATLERSDVTWRSIVTDARERSCLVDADVTYFTSVIKQPVSQSSHAARPTKPVSKAVNIPPPDLFTPQELAASTSTMQTLRAQRKKVQTSIDGDNANDTMPTVAAVSQTILQKRPAEGDLPQRNAEQHLEEKPQQKPKPPAKRQKQAPSLFIPKKRSLPSNAEAGPSSNRRRT